MELRRAMSLPRNISANLASVPTQMLKPNFIVIPGKLATASATRNPGFQEGLDSRFRGNDVGEVVPFSSDFLDTTLDCLGIFGC